MPNLVLHNSLTRRREPLRPLDPQHVRMYVCGPTVYDLAHLGNARAAVVFDVLARLLRALYPRVTYVRNVTDVDDKINARAQASGEPIAAITARTLAEYRADMAALNVLPPDVEPRATAHIAEMIDLITRLIASGHAYEAQGHVLFSVATYAGYGQLSGRSPEDLLAGARVEVAPYKRDPGDFVLWKPSPDELPGWPSPWGRGRPGWHIECSAMSWRYLGADFDIHGGGDDLLFPHHENERAQSCCAFPGSGFARLWVHNGMLLVNGQKMSKSLGNFRTARQALAQAPAEAVRLLLLKAQYRATLDFSDAALADARGEMDRFYRALQTPAEPVGHLPDVVEDALCEDLNTPLALSRMHRLADTALAGGGDAPSAAGLLRAGGVLLGLFGPDGKRSPEDWFRGGAGRPINIAIGVAVLPQPVASGILQVGPTEAEIREAIAARTEARRARDYARADAIRAELLAKGIILEDGPTGTTWRQT